MLRTTNPCESDEPILSKNHLILSESTLNTIQIVLICISF